MTMTIKKPSQGVIYCAIDKWSYFEAAIISAFALHQLSPQLPIIIITNINQRGIQEWLLRFNIDIKIIVISENQRAKNVMVSRLIKTSLNTFTDFDETLYLDADILPLQSIEEIWSFLDNENIAMAIDMKPTISECIHISEDEKNYTLETCSADTVQFNGGVMLWRNTPDVHTLFETWHKEWNRFKQHDQLALSRAFQQSKTEITHLPYNYNYSIVWLAKIYQIENVGQINNFKCYKAPELNTIKLLHCYKSMLDVLDERAFYKIAEIFIPNLNQLQQFSHQ
jgi:lipopolysaccharide biosynthesis glycosyltransferase